MPSPAHCFEKFGIHVLEQNQIRKLAKQYRADGFEAKDAMIRATEDHLATIRSEKDAILNQVKDHLTKTGRLVEAIPPAEKPTAPETKPIPQPELPTTTKEEITEAPIMPAEEAMIAKPEEPAPTREAGAVGETAIQAIITKEKEGELAITGQAAGGVTMTPGVHPTQQEITNVSDILQRILPRGVKFGFVEELAIDTRDPRYHQSMLDWIARNPGVQIPLQIRIGGQTIHTNIPGQGLMSLIQVALKDFTGDTVAHTGYHEAWHAIQGMLLSADEKRILRDRFKNDETISDAFADFAMNHKRLLPNGVKGIFTKIRDFIDALGNYLAGRGFRSVNDIFGQALAGKLMGQPRGPALPAGGLGAAQTAQQGGVPTSSNPYVEDEFEKAYGLSQATVLDRAKANVMKFVHSFTRHFPLLNRDRFGKAIDSLRRYEQIPEYAKKTAYDQLKAITQGFNKHQLKLFGRIQILRDLVRDIEDGLYGPTSALPFQYASLQEIRDDLGRFEAHMNTQPNMVRADQERKNIWATLRQKLVNAEILDEGRLEDDRYFHHQVLQYMSIKAMGPLAEIKQPYVGLSSLDVRLHKKGWQIAREGSAEAFNTSYLEAEFEVLSQAIAQLETVKTLDELQAAEDISGQLKREAKQFGLNSREWKQMLKRHPGYTVWQPKKGFNFYMANTIADKYIKQVLGQQAFEIYKATGKVNIPGVGFVDIENVPVRRALAVGGRRTEWAIPEELAKTLDDFKDFKDEGPIFRAAQYVQTSWKQWTLLSPLRVVKYNLNNLSGDADITMAYDPKIITKFGKQATKDLWAQLRGKQPKPLLKKELDKALQLGVIGSGITVHEIPDISDTGIFKLLTGQKPTLVERYWNTVKDFTNFRENVLRLAAFRYFKEQARKGNIVYGASKKEEIDKIANTEERAAKLARELIGDYGNISQAGQWLRRNLIPFYCVPDDAEILTRDGWKTIYDLNVNKNEQFEEQVLTYNMDGDFTEWQSLNDVAMFGTSGPHDLMTLSNNKGTKFRFTEEHRWPIIEPYSNKRKIVRACDFKSHYKIPVVAPHKNQSDTILSVHEASLLGWIVTDGYFRIREYSPNSFEAMIYQSPKKYSDQIRTAFAEDISSESVHPDTGVICFRIKTTSLQNIRKYFKSKEDLPSIVTRLNRAGLEAIFDAMMAAEGSRHETQGDAFGQKNGGPVLDAFQIVCYLLGKAFNIGQYKNGQHAGYIKKRDKISLHKWQIGKEVYSGIVWCPRTQNSTWIMRQNGKVIITGNSWMEINAPRYVRMMRNLNYEQRGGAGRVAGVGAMALGRKGIKFSAQVLGLYAMVSLFNAIVFPDEDDEMKRSGRRELQLILGRRADGSIRSLRIQGALSDALQWFRLEDFPDDMKDVLSGKVSWTKKLKEAALGPIERVVQSARPIEKAIGEAAAGKTFYPDITKPRPIRDKTEYILKTLGLDLPYKYATRLTEAPKPMRGGAGIGSLIKDLESIATYRTEPGEGAYYTILNKEIDFLREQGEDVPEITPTKKSTILYYYKMSQRYGDKKAAQAYMERYVEAGGTKQDLMKSIKKSHPLAILPIKYRQPFLSTLDGEDRKALETAIDWWQKIYGG